MVFSSMLFVFVFLTLNLLSQILIKDVTNKNIAMLAFSLLFYSWAGPAYLFLIAGMSLICWAGALGIERYAERSKAIVIATVTAALVILGVFKYTGFFLSNFQSIFGVPEVIPKIALPIGISFYTFQLISYVVDVYRGEVRAQRKYWILLLYASLFHQCVAGPIIRYSDIYSDLLTRKPTVSDISDGISRFTCGLAKKAVLANGCAAIADKMLVADQAHLAQIPAMGILLGAFAYTLQIYLDFSAYSDMAIGMGRMCGLHYKENFNYPYISSSVTEFWRRWHISLSSFFRDYVYIPLGGNRKGRRRQFVNIFVVWGLTGLWHGASWNFVFWGLYYGVLLVLERFVLEEKLEKVPAWAKHVILMLLVVFGWILFRFTDAGLLGTAVAGLFGLNGNGFINAGVTMLFKNNVFFLLLSCIACLPVVPAIKRFAKTHGMDRRLVYKAWDIAHPALFLFISAMALAGDSYNPFIYFRF